MIQPHIQPHMRPHRTRSAGFTLVEIMVALAIVGTALVVLLQAHYASQMLFDQAQQETLMQGFLEHAIGLAEAEVLAGRLSGSGDFGKRYPDYSYSFSAQQAGQSEMVPLYGVMVTVSGPGDVVNLDFMVFNLGQFNAAQQK